MKLFWPALAMLFAVDVAEVRAQNPVLDLEDPSWSHDAAWIAYTVQDEALAAVRADPTNVEARIKRAQTLAVRGDLDLAHADYDEAVRLAPHSANVLYERAQFFSATGQQKKAEEDKARHPRSLRAATLSRAST